MKRKLLAIVAADMVGFSRLIEDDEITILSRQKVIFNKIIKPEIKKFNGEIIKTTGDGFLAKFDSSLDAVESSFQIQKRVNLLEEKFSSDKRIWYRFGINVGDVVLDEGDVFGNCVNIASRLETISDAGGICITGDIFQNIKNLKSYNYKHLGNQRLKNISQLINVYKIIVDDKILDIENPKSKILTEVDQEIRYCSSNDGTTIAYAKVGNGPPLIKAPNFMSSLEHDWRSPIWNHIYRFLGKDHTLIRFDQRGNGSSDWDTPNISFELFLEDMETVVNASKLDKFPLYGVSQGCPLSIAYAVKHPEKVSHLILFGGYAKGRAKRGDTTYEANSTMEQTMILSGWENENPAFRQFFTSSMIPDASKEQMDTFNNICKIATSAKNAAKISLVNDNIDVSDLLSKVNIPTIIFHCTEDARVPISEGKFLAANIKNSKFVPLKSKNHLILETDKEWIVFQSELNDFFKKF
jgi:class 3 adenylate cyclase/pimeloyl-ACP methyl ester carboxylesterase